MSDKVKLKISGRFVFSGVAYAPGEWNVWPEVADGIIANGHPVVLAELETGSGARPMATATETNGEDSEPVTDDELLRIKSLTGDIPSNFPGAYALAESGISKFEDLLATPAEELVKLKGVKEKLLSLMQARLRQMVTPETNDAGGQS